MPELTLTARDLVAAELFPTEEAAIAAALAHYLTAHRDQRLTAAARRYAADDGLTIQAAAALAGVDFESFKAALNERGIILRLGPADLDDAREEVAAFGHITDAHAR